MIHKYLIFNVTKLLGLAVLFYSSSLAANNLVQVGNGHFKVAFFSIFKSQLYTLDGTYQESSRPLQLHLQYQRNIKAKQLIKQTQKEWQHLNMQHQARHDWLKKLEKMWPDISKHDTLSLVINEQGVSEFLFNEKPIGKIVDPEFGKHFIAIWLSPNTSAPAHRKQLLKINNYQ